MNQSIHEMIRPYVIKIKAFNWSIVNKINYKCWLQVWLIHAENIIYQTKDNENYNHDSFWKYESVTQFILKIRKQPC